ncbi:MAG: tRNA pseudouridine(55) synthase TruB [Planctomycetota bacterium]|nr:tRNA pseudouridine(55) synthase TruB [Planctomycetota bacterium]
MPRLPDAPDGGIIIWKPRGPSSRTVLDQVQRRLQWGGLGHCGTLDPLASGVMVIIGGAARRFQQMLTVHNKTYIATIWLGVISDTQDAEGPLACPYPPVEIPPTAQINSQLARLTGSIEQVPPAHSAVRVAGRRSYQRAREGDLTPPPARSVRVDSIEMLEHQSSRLQLKIDCGPGTYIRSLARDLGQGLGCGASLMALRRTASGDFDEPMAKRPDQVERADWWSLERLLEYQPCVEVDAVQAQRLGHGQALSLEDLSLEDLDVSSCPPEPSLVVWSQQRVRGIARISREALRPQRWLAERNDAGVPQEEPLREC